VKSFKPKDRLPVALYAVNDSRVQRQKVRSEPRNRRVIKLYSEGDAHRTSQADSAYKFKPNIGGVAVAILDGPLD
jgi:hypothetical protein